MFNVRNRWSGSIQFTAEIDCAEDASIHIKAGLALKWAYKNGVDLRGVDLRGVDLRGVDLRGADLSDAVLRDADLSGAVLRDADLSGADLSGAVLRGADLRGAVLSDADLRGAVLSDADLSGADLSGAVLRGADLSDADLSGADLSGAVLRGADLRGADLSDADLSGADLSGADLSGAVLRGAKIPKLAAAQTSIVPEEGDYIGWKKCADGVIVKLLIPAKARRSSATGRKCRAEFAKVLDVIGGKTGVSLHDGTTEYAKGETVKCDKWGDNRWEECSGGIHHYITRTEAENH